MHRNGDLYNITLGQDIILVHNQVNMVVVANVAPS